MAFGDGVRQYIQVKMENIATPFLESLAKDLAKKAQDKASWVDRTGKARKGIYGGVTTKKREKTIFLDYSEFYGRFLEKGAKPHIIKPKIKKALFGGRLEHPVMKVEHPGMRGHHVLETTVKQNRDYVLSKIRGYFES